MSRRKQAKPRALKHEGDDDENAAAEDDGAAAECEVKSAMDTSDDEDADRCQPDKEEDDERSGDEFVLDEASRTSGRVNVSVNDRGVMSESDRKEAVLGASCAMASSAEMNGQTEPAGPTDNDTGESHCPGPTATMDFSDGPDGVDGIKSEVRFERDSIHSGEFGDDAEDGGEDEDDDDDDEDLDDEDIDDEMDEDDDDELLTAGPDDDELTSDSFCSDLYLKLVKLSSDRLELTRQHRHLRRHRHLRHHRRLHHGVYINALKQDGER
ncbi:nucleolin-like [Anopheles cruzii]|uniref:nucleolin-like n=1 Tax=Anopheles cruzii TaxID=68878 RepID=UPI0022EC662B|nr:nucleolin-like [Anopheles cruzii]